MMMVVVMNNNNKMRMKMVMIMTTLTADTVLVYSASLPTFWAGKGVMNCISFPLGIADFSKCVTSTVQHTHTHAYTRLRDWLRDWLSNGEVTRARLT